MFVEEGIRKEGQEKNIHQESANEAPMADYLPCTDVMSGDMVFISN